MRGVGSERATLVLSGPAPDPLSPTAPPWATTTELCLRWARHTSKWNGAPSLSLVYMAQPQFCPHRRPHRLIIAAHMPRCQERQGCCLFLTTDPVPDPIHLPGPLAHLTPSCPS
mmetsp:Transcript_123445/g.214065  ORF Transcript_123445/g.214065 Transcript_123445/m.214065 type:complete len:114 (-) Transcript_123445:556-897(-)